MLGYVEIFWDMLRYFEICWDILRYVEKNWDILRKIEIFWDMLRKCEIFCDILRYFEICWDMLRYFEICWGILIYVEIFWDMLRKFEIFWENLRYFEICWEKLRYFEIFWDMLRYFEICSDSLTYFKICWCLSPDSQTSHCRHLMILQVLPQPMGSGWFLIRCYEAGSSQGVKLQATLSQKILLVLELVPRIGTVQFGPRNFKIPLPTSEPPVAALWTMHTSPDELVRSTASRWWFNIPASMGYCLDELLNSKTGSPGKTEALPEPLPCAEVGNACQRKNISTGEWRKTFSTFTHTRTPGNSNG